MDEIATKKLAYWRISIAGALACSVAGAIAGVDAKENIPPISPATNVMLAIQTTDGQATLCIDNTGSKKVGAGLHAWKCNRRNANQRFDITAAPKNKSRDNAVLFKSRHSGHCVSATSATAIRSARVNQARCAAGDRNLAWSPRKQMRGGWVVLRNRGTGNCLEIRRNKSLIGADIIQRRCRDSNPHQYFRVIR